MLLWQNRQLNDLPDEKWLPIPKYTAYEISNLGRVKSLGTHLKRKNNSIRGAIILKQRLDISGYPKVALYRNGKAIGKTVHRLVAMVFIPRIKGKKFVNHKRGIRHDNRATELEWCTSSENAKHGFIVNGRINPNKGKTGLLSSRGRPVILINRFTNEHLYFESGNLATITLGLTNGSLQRVLSGKYKFTKSYFARYANQPSVSHLT